VEPQDIDHGFDESFMRNFGGYIGDCEKAGLAPSIFQIVLFLYNSEIVMTPPFWLPISFLVLLHHVFGYWVGGFLLGYVNCHFVSSWDIANHGTGIRQVTRSMLRVTL
jgi:hypothetical protein